MGRLEESWEEEAGGGGDPCVHLPVLDSALCGAIFISEGHGDVSPLDGITEHWEKE